MSSVFGLLDDYIDKSIHALRKHRHCSDIDPCGLDGCPTGDGMWPEVSEALVAYQTFKRCLDKEYSGKIKLEIQDRGN